MYATQFIHTHTQLNPKVIKIFLLLFFVFCFLAIVKDPVFAFTCGDNLTINHSAAGGVAPVDKTVTYGTVLTDLTGEDMCWITQNLGADQQATAVDDATEASAGWYWQFNRKQGYKQDGVILTPSWTITEIDEDKDWESANDPCALELGTGWRLVTYDEWYSVTEGWSGDADVYTSLLKLHKAGYLENTGDLYMRGGNGSYWTNIQGSSQFASNWYWYGSDGIGWDNNPKAEGRPVRCLHEAVFPTPTPSPSSTPTPTLTPTTAPVSQTPNVSSSSSAPSCTAQTPLFAPDLFQIDTTKTKAILWYAPVPDPVTRYFIAYGTDKDNLQHGVEYDQGYSGGVLSYTINELAPNTTYYFRIRAGNSCMPGPWDSLFKAKTTNSKTSVKKYYRYCLFHRLCIF